MTQHNFHLFMQGSCAKLKDCSVCRSNSMALPRGVVARAGTIARNASAMASKAVMSGSSLDDDTI
jgi:hypothetical protein